MDTKLVHTYRLNTTELEAIIHPYIESKLNEITGKLLGLIKTAVIPGIMPIISKRWVYMENRPVIYDHEVAALFPNLGSFQCLFQADTSFKLVKKSNLKFDQFQGDVMTLEEVKRAFTKRIAFPYKADVHKICYDGTKTSYRMAFMKDATTLNGYDMDDDSIQGSSGVIMPIYRLNGVNSTPMPDNKVLYNWLRFGLEPIGMPAKTKEYYRQLLQLVSYLELKDSGLSFNQAQWLKDINEGKFTGTVMGFTFDYASILKELRTNKQKLAVESSILYDRFLHGDKHRADLESYEERMLTDPSRGHWDLWETDKRDNSADGCLVELKPPLVARNPKADLKRDGVIGIDFGTKSTVVAHQESSEYTLPMRVGVGQFNKKVETKQYENPTVMEFIDLHRFLAQYQANPARPQTLWEDLTVSHTAFNSLMTSSSEFYYTFLSELKQWAGDQKRVIRLKDKKGKDVILPAFKDLLNGDLNPIELYAYYIGLYINNQHNGIYLDYTLSFPVTYEKAIQQKIVESFRKGLLKSLPSALHQDQETMELFRVSIGPSEPAAYAVCALQEYGFEPEGEERIFYGIFDFGGGTTDFDFGIWREAGSDERRFDYVIEHFGAGGDRYLGGEHVLELMAYEIFKDNQERLREEGLSFALPSDPEVKRFPGSEILLTDAQESRLNMKQLMEKLRPLWERHNDYEKLFDKGVLKVNLFDKLGKSKPNFELAVNRENLEQKLGKRIEKGIRNFFEALRQTFSNPNHASINKVHIFLAGNSSKSPMVRELFEQYMKEESGKIAARAQKPSGEYFELYPPLGTEEAYAKQEERGVPVDRSALTRPTGKTGVAFGLLKSRRGGKIKVVDRNVSQDEVKFKYYLGISKKGSFRVTISREEPYGKWHNFIDASEEDFEIYYTSLPEATRNQLPIQQVQRKKCRIDQTRDSASVYLRTVSPTVIEYVVATEDELKGKLDPAAIRVIELS